MTTIEPKGHGTDIKIPESAKTMLEELAKKHGLAFAGCKPGWRAAHAALMQGYFTFTPGPKVKPISERASASKPSRGEPSEAEPDMEILISRI